MKDNYLIDKNISFIESSRGDSLFRPCSLEAPAYYLIKKGYILFEYSIQIDSFFCTSYFKLDL